MVLLEFLYNINSDRQLCEEIGYNLAYRWFCKLSLIDKVPDHSSIKKILEHMELPSTAPRPMSARGPPASDQSDIFAQQFFEE